MEIITVRRKVSKVRRITSHASFMMNEDKDEDEDEGGDEDGDKGGDEQDEDEDEDEDEDWIELASIFNASDEDEDEAKHLVIRINGGAPFRPKDK